MFFDNWFALLRILVVGLFAYGSLIIMLRVSGKRTLSKLNAFDLIVTVALGSTLATVVLSKDVALVEGLLAFFWLIALQFVIAWLSVRSSKIEQLVKGDPALLFYQGRFLDKTMRRERLTEEEVVAAVRQQGLADLNSVHAVVLETDGSISVVKQGAEGAAPSLRTVKAPASNGS